MPVRQGAWDIIRPVASSLKPLHERSASTRECPLRWISRAGRQAGRYPEAPSPHSLRAGVASFHAGLAKPPGRPASHTVGGRD